MSSEETPREENTEENSEENRPRRRSWIIGGVVAAGLLVLTVGAVALVVVVGLSGSSGGGSAAAPVNFEEEYVTGSGADKIAVIPVEGIISPADSGVADQVPTTTPDGLRDALQQAEDDESVAAVMLEINSPGGGVTASDQMHQHIVDFKESSDKPVVVSMGTTAASGGYYIAAPADEIFANSTTLTGSLGVIIQLPDLSEAAKKVGVEQEIIKSGKFKDMGSSFRNITPEEREIFQSIVDEDYDRFVQVIVEGRDLPEDRVRNVADGRVYSGEQAEELNLVDGLGDLEDAAKAARERANVDEARVVRYVQTQSFSDLLRARLEPQEPQAVQVLEAAGLDLKAEPQYLYLPGR